MINQSMLLELFDYIDGELYWKVATTNRHKANRIAGSICGNGYKYTGIYGKRYKNHRLIWMMHYGDMPKEIDHIDRNPLNNKIENLRPANRTENCSNTKARKNASGYRNVQFNKLTNKWGVKINVNKKSISFGTYDDLELAAFVAQEARNKYHKEFASHATQ